jgi:drug/metabolite transporter (DMT)-like permease
VSVALGVLVLGESVGPVVLLGAGVVIAASLLIGRAPVVSPRVRRTRAPQ